MNSTSHLDVPTLPQKTALISLAASLYNVRSLIDVGACWGVNAGYTFHALDDAGFESAWVADGSITALTRERAAGRSDIKLVEGNIGSAAFVEKLPAVDLAILYDVLLHQVSPNWDEFLALYAAKANHLVIYNQDWNGPTTVRFPDHDLDWYMSNVTYVDKARLVDWYSKHDEHNAALNRPWRDVFYFWQWGITAGDIISKMSALGYQLDFFWNYGVRTHSKPRIEDHAFLFSRAGLYPKRKMPTVSL